MQIRVLGPVDVVDDEGNNVTLGGPTQVRVLAALVAAAPQHVAIDTLVAQLWPGEDAPDNPVGTVRTYVARLRRSLGPEAVVTAPGAYGLGSVETDAARFADLVERARRMSGSPTVTDLWSQAVGLWRGPAFGDLADLESVRPEAARLNELRAEATEALFDARLAAGEGRELTAAVETAVNQFPLREGFRAQQMTVLARAGRQADALRSFQQFRADLTEVGLEPSTRLVELDSQIARGEVPRSGARRTLRGYELGDRLGAGAFAQVWAATQSSVGREVAIKQIRASLADQPEFIRQFEAEAQLVARLEHPHIVPLYDYWREPGSAYLVMRYLDGGSLANALMDGPLELEHVVAIAGQVAAALNAAQEAGVIHRDVKPGNILLDRAGNAYLSDFGIAVEEAERLDAQAWLSNGSPAYAPPEQLQRLPVGPTADIYALAVTVYEALTGNLPFPTETTMAGLLQRQLNDPIPRVRSSRPDIPAAVDTVIQKATAKKADDRYQTAQAFAADLAAAAGLHGDETLITPEDRNPYKGMRAFTEADAGDFTGRERLVNRLIETLTTHRIAAVVGPSGSGKSSVVRAGLVPAIRGGRIPGSDQWFVTTMIPGADPFADLETALLSIAVDPPADLEHQLTGNTRGLARVLRQIVPKDRQLVLIIDQFEELFTLTETQRSNQFLDTLAAALAADRQQLQLVVTLRADFYDRPLRHPRFAALIEDATVTVPPLAADELERAIVEPAAAVGARFEPGLVAQITADVADQPGALPLLQYTLTELFDHQAGHILTLDSYERFGGISRSIAGRADELFEQGGEDEQQAVQEVFTRLVALGEGTEDTRRRVERSELPETPAVAAVLERYGEARLLSFDRNPTTREQTVEVAHEALIRHWPRLRTWVDINREGLRIHRHLTETSAAWQARGRDAGDLYRAGRLESARAWSEAHQADLNPVEAEFLEASVARHQAEIEAERQRLRRLRRLLGAVAVVAVIAAIAGAVALVQQNRANEAAARAEDEAARADASANEASERADDAEAANDLARARELAAASIQALDGDPQLAIMLALAGQDLLGGTAPPAEVVTALRQAVAEGRLHSFQVRPIEGPAGIMTATLSPTGDRVAVGDISGTSFEIRSADDLSVLSTHSVDALVPDDAPEGLHQLERLTWTEGQGLVVQLVAFGPETQPGPFSSDWSTLAVVDPDSGEATARNVVDYSCVSTSDVSADGSLVVLVQSRVEFECGDADGRTIVVDTATGEVVHDLTLFSGSEQAHFDATATRMVIGARDGMAVIDIDSGEPVLTRFDDSGKFIVSISDDGSRVAAQEFLSANPVEIIDVDSGRTIDAVRPGSTLNGLSYEGGDRLVAVTDQGEIQIWDPNTGRTPLVFSSSIHEPTRFDASVDLERLLSFNLGSGDMAVWNLATAVVGLEASQQFGPAIGRSWQAADGRIAMASVALDATGRPESLTGHVLDESTGEVVAGPFENLWRVIPVDDETLFAAVGVGSDDNPQRMALIDVATGNETVLPGFCPTVIPGPNGDPLRCAPGTEGQPLLAQMMAASPNGNHLVVFSTEGDLWFFDGQTLETINTVDVAPFADAVVAVNDAGIAWTDSQPNEIFVDGATGEVRVVEGGPGGGGHCWWGEYIDPDTVVCISRDGVVWVMDAESASVIDSHAVSKALPVDFDVSPDGLLAVATDDGTVTIWDMDEWTLLDTFDFDGVSARAVHWLGEDRFLVGVGTGAVLTMTRDVDTLVATAREAVARDMTVEECNRYRLTCPR